MSEHTRRGGREPTWPTPHGRIPGWLPVFNRLSKRILAAGLSLGPNALVTIRGRKSGMPRTTPVAIIEHEGRRWIWAPSGDVQWVKNLRAAGRATISIGKRTEEVGAVELDPAQRIAFFRDTLATVARRIPIGFAFIRIVDRVDLNRPAEAAEGRAVFELTRVR
jgi:deazaflavin-dependent oxidoreductase (nitroreductase family)